jgi:hypothetical protein
VKEIMSANNPSDVADVKGNESDNLSFESFVALRSQIAESEEVPEQEQTDVETTESEEEVTEQEQEFEETEEETEEESSEEEEPNDIDLLNLSVEQIQELAKKGKSRLLQRIGELTAQKKALEEQLQTAQPKVKEVPQEQNPFGNIDSFDDLKAKYEEVETTLNKTDELLDEYEDYGPDDVISVGDKEFTKREIRKANRNAKDAITKYLPAQQQHIAKLQQFNQLSEQYKAAAAKEVPEIADKDSEVGKKYSELVSDPLIEKVKSQVPEIGFQIEYILAHAARSIFGGKAKVTTGAGQKLKVEPPSSPVGSGSARSSKSPKAAVQERYKQFEHTGSADDWVAARIAKLKS